MQVNRYSSPQASYNKNNQPSFKGPGQIKTAAQGAFNWLGNACKIENGSLSREMFFAISFLFLVGARFVESRDKDEKREVLTRDIPAVAVSGYGAMVLNNSIARKITEKTGIPITFKDKKMLSFATQKQVKDWYTGLSTIPDTLVSFAETVERNGGNIQKVMKKFGFDKELNAISNATDNKGVINAIKQAKTKNAPAFEALEKLLKNVGDKNEVLKFAKNTQAAVKLGCLALTAAFLGYFLPRLNIIITKKKCAENQPQVQNNHDNGVMKVSTYHSEGARQSFKNFFNMVSK